MKRDDFNPFKFDEIIEEKEKKNPRKKEKLERTTENLRIFVQCTLWFLSAMLSFAFGYQWLGAIFPFSYDILAGIAGGLFVAFTFDVGAIVSLYVQDYVAETEDQQEIARRVKWVDFSGSLVASVAQIVFFIPDTFLTVNEGIQTGMGWFILLTTIAVFSYNLFESINYHEASPETLKAKHNAEQKAKALKRRQDREKAAADIADLMSSTDTDAEIETLKEVHNQYMIERAEIVPFIVEKKKEALKQKLMIREGLITVEGTGVKENTPTQPKPTAVNPPAPTPTKTPPAPARVDFDALLSQAGYSRQDAAAAIKRYGVTTPVGAYNRLIQFNILPPSTPLDQFTDFYHQITTTEAPAVPMAMTSPSKERIQIVPTTTDGGENEAGANFPPAPPQ